MAFRIIESETEEQEEHTVKLKLDGKSRMAVVIDELEVISFYADGDTFVNGLRVQYYGTADGEQKGQYASWKDAKNKFT